MSGLVQFFGGAVLSKDKRAEYGDSVANGSLLVATARRRTPLHPPTRTDTVTFAQWKEHQLGWLGAFMEERLRHDPNEEMNEANSNNENLTGTQSSQGDSSANPTPPSPLPLPLAQTMTSQTDRQHSHELMPSIPHHMDETFHRATSLNDLNLRTQQVHLGRLRVQKVWSERLTHRPAVTHVFPRRQEFYTHLSEFIPMSLKPCLEDGPMGPIYHSVISVEVAQQQQASSSQETTASASTATDAAQSEHDQVKKLAHAAAMASSSSTASCQYTRLMVFFYNQYAKALSYIVSQYAHASANKHLQLHMELIHVPAVSIMPFGSGQTDWFNQDSLTPYCICVGARSNMTVRRDSDGKKVHRRFDGLYQNGVLVPDTEHVLIKVALVDERTEERKVVREWEISQNYKSGPVKYLLDVTKQQEEEEAQKRQAKASKKKKAAQRKRSQVTETSQGANAPKRRQVLPADEEPPNTSARQAKAVEPQGRTHTMINQAYQAQAQQQQPLQPLSPPRPLKPTITGAKIRDLLGEQGVPISEDDGTKYHALGELEEYYKSFRNTNKGNHKPCFVNIYALVIGIKSASRTKTGDYMVSYSLVDQSLDEGLSSDKEFRAIQINIFEKEEERLPDVQMCGDVIRIHRAKIQIYKDTLQLLGLKGTSYMCFRRGQNYESDQENSGVSVILSPSKKCSYRKTDEVQLPRMWEWGQERISSRPTIHQEHASTLAATTLAPQNHGLDEISEERDLTVMVTAIIDQVSGAGDSDPVGFLRVWDGTPGTFDPYPTQKSATSLPLLGDPPAAAIDRLCNIVDKLNASNKDCEMIIPDSVTGRVANVAIWELSMWRLITKGLQPGMFVRLRNVKVGNFCHVPCINAHKSTHLTPLPDMTYEVIQMIQEHDRRLRRGEPLNRESGVRSLHVEEIQGRIDQDHKTSDMARFVAQCTPGLFTGPVKVINAHHSMGETSFANILRQFQENRFLRVTLMRDSEEGEEVSLDALVKWTSPAGKQLRHVLSHKMSLRDQIWQARILGVVKEQSKYFVLDHLES